MACQHRFAVAQVRQYTLISNSTSEGDSDTKLIPKMRFFSSWISLTAAGLRFSLLPVSSVLAAVDRLDRHTMVQAALLLTSHTKVRDRSKCRRPVCR